ncbi:hypothetical protein ACFPRL_09985 [Pseudoclavibacter helvolus]
MGAAASDEHQPEGCHHRGALPRERAARARRAREGDGRNGVAQGGGAVQARHRQILEGARIRRQPRRARSVLGHGHRPGKRGQRVHGDDTWSAAMFSDCPQPECDDFYAANVSGP